MERAKSLDDYFPFIEHHLKGHDYRLEIAFFDRLAAWMFSDVEVIGLDRLAEQRKAQESKAVNIYYSRHLSECDWHEIQRSLAHRHMMSAVQAGANLFIGPTDPILRHMGSFKVFREDTKAYSPGWSIPGTICAAAHKIGIPLGKETKIDMQLSKEIYTAYVRHLLLEEKRDLLIFPEYAKAGAETKYGRSYTGELLEFSPLISRMLLSISREADHTQLVPVNVSYERVVEDQTFATQRKMKHDWRKSLTYVYDFGFLLSHRIYQRPGRLTVKFGEPLPMTRDGFSEVRQKVGELQTVYPTQVLAFAMGDSRSLKYELLCDNVCSTMSRLADCGADLHNISSMHPVEIIESAYLQFNQPLRSILERDSGSFKAVRPDVISQYKNQISHLI